jgi:hypothetical protein
LKEGINSRDYAHYVRLTMAIVMIGAGLQKFFAGTFITGALFNYFANADGLPEKLIGYACFGALDPAIPCPMLKVLGTGAIIWQFAVGLALLFNFRQKWVLWVEILFLLTVGVWADELAFQMINIALLSIAFGLRIYSPAAVGLVMLIFFIDDYSLSQAISTYVPAEWWQLK